MLKYVDTIVNQSGDVLTNYRVQLVNESGTIVPIFKDRGGTRFVDASGNPVDYVIVDERGRVEFYWEPDVSQVFQTLDVDGNLVDAVSDFSDRFVLNNLGGTLPQESVEGLAGQFDAANGKLPNSPRYDQEAAADGTTDDSAAVASSLAAKDIVQIDGLHRLTQTQTLSFEQSMQGFGREGQIIVTGTESLTNDILFRVNTDATGATITQPFPAHPATRISNLRINGDAARANSLTAFTFGGGLIVDNVQANGFAVGFKQSTDANSYSDKVTFRQVHFERNAAQTADQYLIDLNYLGDATLLQGVEFRIVSGAGGTEQLVNGLRAKTRLGIHGDGIINGKHRIDRCFASTFEHSHIEAGGFDFYDSVLSFNDNVIWQRVNDATYTDAKRVPVRFLTGDANARAGRYAISGLTVVHWPTFKSGYASNAYDLETQGRTDIKIDNAVRWFASDTGNIDNATFTGIRAWDGTNPLTAFNRYSHFASEQSRLRNGKLDMRVSTPAIAATQGLRTGGTTTFRTWAAASGTVHVAVQILVDPVRQIGVNGSQTRSHAVTNGGAGILIDLDGPNHPYIARLFFGPSAGSYDKVVEVPCMGGARKLHYNGVDIGGLAPAARTAGPVDAINTTLAGAFQLEPADNGALAYGVATMRSSIDLLARPTNGTFRPGDRIENRYGILEFDGTDWFRSGGRNINRGNTGDADFDMSTASWNGGFVRSVTNLTADRSIFLPPPVGGSQSYIIKRESGGAFNLNIVSGGSTLLSLAAGESAVVNPTADWLAYTAVKVGGVPATYAAQQWTPNFTAATDVYIPANVAMTIAQGNPKIGTGTLAFEKSTAAAPGTFSSTTLPATLEAGAWLKVTASAVTGFVATHLVRSA